MYFNSYCYKKLKKIVIQIRENDGTVVEIEINHPFVDFYKRETGRRKVFAKHLSNFINHPVDLHSS